MADTDGALKTEQKVAFFLFLREVPILSALFSIRNRGVTRTPELLSLVKALT